MLKLLNRLVCCVLGHKSLVRVDDDFPIRVPVEKFTTYGVTSTKSIQYNILAIPYDSTVEICSRCQSVYWQNATHHSHLCALAEIPGLNDFYTLYNRFIWEREQRKQNHVARKLYNQYLMVLKLNITNDHSDE